MRRILIAAACAAVLLTTMNIVESYVPTGESLLLLDQGTTEPIPLPSSERPRSDMAELPPSIPSVAASTSTSARTAPPSSSTAPRTNVPAGPSVAVGKRVVFVGDYQTGNLSQWDTCQGKFINNSCGSRTSVNYSLAVVANGVRQGVNAAKFVVRDGDVPDFGGGERSEVADSSAGALTQEGDERWYQWSMMMPASFPNPDGGWFIVMQWHAGSGSPPLAINISNKGTVDIGGDGVDHPTRTLGPVRRGQWVDYTLHVKFSPSSGTGFVEGWENDVKTVPKTMRATMSSGENYLKQGIYRDGDASGTAEVWLAGLRVTAP